MNSGFGVNQLVSPPMETAVSSITGKGSERTDPNSSLDTSEVLGAIGNGPARIPAKRNSNERNSKPEVQTDQEKQASDEESNRATLELETNDFQKASKQQGIFRPQFATDQFHNHLERGSKAIGAPEQSPEQLFAGKEPTFAPAAVCSVAQPATNDKLLFEPVFDDCFDDGLVDEERKADLAPSKSAHFNNPSGEYIPDGSRLTWNNHQPQSDALLPSLGQNYYQAGSPLVDPHYEHSRVQGASYAIPRLNQLPRQADMLFSGVDCEELEGGSSNRNLPTFGKGSFRSSKSGSRGQHRSNSANREQYTRYHQRLPGGQIDELMYHSGVQDNQGNHSILDLSNQSQAAEMTDRQGLEDFDGGHYASQQEPNDSTEDGTLFYIKVIDFQNNERLLQISKYDDYKTTVARFFHEQHIYDVALMICLQKRIQREIERYNLRNGHKTEDTQASAGKLGQLQSSQPHLQHVRGFERQNLRLETDSAHKAANPGAKLPPRSGVSPSSSTGKRQFIPPAALLTTPEAVKERSATAVDNMKRNMNQKSVAQPDRCRLQRNQENSHQNLPLIIDPKLLPPSTKLQALSSQRDPNLWRHYTGTSSQRNFNQTLKNTKLSPSECSGIARFLAKESEGIMKTQHIDQNDENHLSSDRVVIYQEQKQLASNTQPISQFKADSNNQDAYMRGPQQSSSPLTMNEKKTPPAYLQATPGFCLDQKRASHDLTISSKGLNNKRVLTFGGSKGVSNLSSSLTGSQSGLGLGKENSRLLANKKPEHLQEATSSIRSVFKQLDNGLSNSSYFENSKKTPQNFTTNSSNHQPQPQSTKPSLPAKKAPPTQGSSMTSGPAPQSSSSGLSLLGRKDSSTTISKQLASGSKPTQPSKSSAWAAEQSLASLHPTQSKHKPPTSTHATVGLQSQRNLRSSFTLSQSFSGAQSTVSPKPAPATSRVAGSSPAPQQASRQPAASGSLSSKFGVLAPSQLLALRSLFGKLDGDMDGVISSDRISLITHSSEVVRTFEPLLAEIKKNPGRPYDYPMFEEVMRRMKLVPEAVRLYQKLTKTS